MGLYWNLAKGIAHASKTASDATVNATITVSQNRRLRRGGRAAARGVLGPGDPPPPPGSSDYYDYRGVATRRELEPLAGQPFSLGRHIDPKKGIGKPIGLPEGALLRHAAVIGPSGSGKTKSILLPWAAAALQAGASVVLLDVTGDLLDDLAIVRGAMGPFNARVAKWDYTDPAHSVSWNWVSALRDDDAIASMTEALIGRERPNDPQPFFHQRDRRTLRGLLEVVHATRPNATTADVLALVHDQRALTRVRDQVRHSAGARRLADVLQLAPSEYGRAVAGVVNALEPLDHPGVKAVTARPELDLERLFDVPTLLVVAAPLHGTRTSEVVGGLILSQIIRVLYRRFGSTAGTHAFLVVDEAPRLAGRLNFEELLSVSRRARVSVCLAAQDVTQFGDDKERTAILSNCANYVALPSSSEPAAKYFASRLGSRRQSVVGISNTTSGGQPGRSLNYTTEQTPVLGEREVMDPPWGPRTALVHAPIVAAKPFIVDLTRPEFA
jgi:type IV secretory pathway TraG/TraD family ATPase VirD4